jgi:hypothetical protein
MEDLEIEGIEIDYPSDCSYCEIQIEGSAFSIKIMRESLTLTMPEAGSPASLLETFFEAQKQLSGTPVIKAISPSEK